MPMKDMKRIFPALLLFLNGCIGCGTGSRNEPVDPGLKVYRPAAPTLYSGQASTRIDAVLPGTWARYQISQDGSETTVTYGAVRIEGKSLWVEVVEEGDPRKVSLRRIAFGGGILTARFQEIPASGPSSEIVNQPLSPSPSDATPAPSESVEFKKQLTIGGKALEATVLRRIFRDDSVGREYEEEEAWSGDVPPLLETLEVAGKAAGLVYRKTAASSIALVDWGSNYTPVIK